MIRILEAHFLGEMADQITVGHHDLDAGPNPGRSAVGGPTGEQVVAK